MLAMLHILILQVIALGIGRVDGYPELDIDMRICSDKSLLDHFITGSAEDRFCEFYLDTGLPQQRRCHLSSDKALPDKGIKFELFRFQVLCQ